MRWLDINKKFLMNNKIDNEANNKVDKKVYFEQLGLK